MAESSKRSPHDEHHDNHAAAQPHVPAHERHQHDVIEAAADHAAHDPHYRGSEVHEQDAAQHQHAAHHDHGAHDGHAGHGVMHEGHLTMMRDRFFVCLPLTVIVVLYSPM